MACRVVELEVKRFADHYECMITAQWMIDCNNKKEIEQIENVFAGKDLASVRPRLVFDEVGEDVSI